MAKKKGTPTKDRRLLTKKAVKPEPSEPESDDDDEQSSEESTAAREEASTSSTGSDEPTSPNTSRRSARKQVIPTKRTPAKAARVNNNTVSRVDNARKKPKIRIYKEIAKLQRTTNLLIPKAPFLRLVRDLMIQRAETFTSRRGDLLRITPTALEALREAAECYMVSVFEDAFMLALHAKRVTLMVKDIQLLMSLRRVETNT